MKIFKIPNATSAKTSIVNYPVSFHIFPFFQNARSNCPKEIILILYLVAVSTHRKNVFVILDHEKNLVWKNKSVEYGSLLGVPLRAGGFLKSKTMTVTLENRSLSHLSSTASSLYHHVCGFSHHVFVVIVEFLPHI
jgi:hypothetical protein